MTARLDRIEQRGSDYVVLSEAGKLLGTFPTREKAAERLRQIEAAKGDHMHIKDGEVRRVDRCLGVVHLDKERSSGVLAKIDEATGFLHIDANITRTGVFQYSDRDGNTWGELRTNDEVFDSRTMSSFDLVHLTDDHPAEFVDHNNVKDLMRGMVGNIRRDGDFMRASITVTSQDLIQKVRDGKLELSCGYTATIIADDGVTDDGTSFSARQTDIRGNHVALVDEGRAGPECRLLVDRGDAFTVLEEKPPMETQKIKIGDAEHVVPAPVADALKANTRLVDEAKAYLKSKKLDQFPFKEEEEEEDEEKDKGDDLTKLQDAIAALQAKVDANDLDRQAEPARIDDRVELVADARSVLGADVATRGVSDASLMRQISLKVRPGLEAKLDSHKKDTGYLRASYDAAMERHRNDQENSDDLQRTVNDAHLSGGTQSEIRQSLTDSVNFYYDGPKKAEG